MLNLKPVYILALAPLLLGADNRPPTGTLRSALTVTTTLPRCADSEYLVYRGGGLVCEAITGSGLQVPDCTGKLLTGMGGALACTDKGASTVTQTDVTRVDDLLTRITNAGTTLTMLEQTVTRASAGVYVGVSSVQPSGAIAHAANDTGLNSANSQCNDAFAGSHMCSAWEMYNSVANGGIDSTKTVPKSWIYFPNWHTPLGAAVSIDPLGGVSDDCGQMTYPTNDKKWTGVAVEYNNTVLSTGGVVGLRFHGGNNAFCNLSTLPIACCK